MYILLLHTNYTIKIEFVYIAKYKADVPLNFFNVGIKSLVWWCLNMGVVLLANKGTEMEASWMELVSLQERLWEDGYSLGEENTEMTI